MRVDSRQFVDKREQLTGSFFGKITNIDDL